MGNDSILTCMTHIIIDGVDENDRFCDLLLLVCIFSDLISQKKTWIFSNIFLLFLGSP